MFWRTLFYGPKKWIFQKKFDFFLKKGIYWKKLVIFFEKFSTPPSIAQNTLENFSKKSLFFFFKSHYFRKKLKKFSKNLLLHLQSSEDRLKSSKFCSEFFRTLPCRTFGFRKNWKTRVPSYPSQIDSRSNFLKRKPKVTSKLLHLCTNRLKCLIFQR